MDEWMVLFYVNGLLGVEWSGVEGMRARVGALYVTVFVRFNYNSLGIRSRFFDGERRMAHGKVRCNACQALSIYLSTLAS